MKLSILKLAAVALAAAAAVAPRAHAITASAGSILLGFEQEGSANNLIVNLGSYTQFLANGQLGFTGPSGAFSTPGTTFTLNSTPGVGLSVADLNANFVDWNNNSQENLLQWGVVGYNAATAGTTAGLANRTVFFTVGREDPDVQSDGYNRQLSATQNLWVGDINLLRTALTTISATANSSTSALIAASNENSFSSLNGDPRQWSGLGSVEQSLFGSNRGPTNSYLDFYVALPAPSGQGGLLEPVLLGTFHLSDTGVLTYTTVPEPSTYALMALGLGGLFFLRRRMVALQNTK